MPTWDELIDRNRTTASKAIGATVYSAGNVGNGWDAERVWFAPPNQWRVEDDDGVSLVAGPRWTYRRVEGRLERSAAPSTPRIDTGTVNAWNHMPRGLLVLYRDWPAPEPEPEVSRHGTSRRPVAGFMPAGGRAPEPTYLPLGPAEQADVRGRNGWTVSCEKTRTAPYRQKVTWTFDDETGVVIGCNVGAQFSTVEVADLVVTDAFGPEVFTYDGPYIDSAVAEREREQERSRETHYRDNRGAGNTVERYVGTYGVPLIRTGFSDDDAWNTTVDTVYAPIHEGFEEYEVGLALIDNQTYTGWTVDRFLDLIADRPSYIVIADTMTMAHPEHPVLFLGTDAADTESSHRGLELRAAAAFAGVVEANLSIANVSWEEFIETAGPDGICRA